MVTNINPFIRTLLIVFFAIKMFGETAVAQGKQEYFQIRVYHYTTLQQERTIDTYLERAFIPAAHRQGFANVGVFKPIEQKAERLIYVLLTSKNLLKLVNLDAQLKRDNGYLKEGESYLQAAYDNPPFDRIETILLKAFRGMPQAKLPKLSGGRHERVYELRSYEGATERLSENKIDMFNNGEIDIFEKLNFNAVFYGQVIAGNTMPNLMYMTTFNDMADRNEHWKSFGPLYKPMHDMPEYQNNVSKNVTLLLRPVVYSDY